MSPKVKHIHVRTEAQSLQEIASWDTREVTKERWSGAALLLKAPYI
jgi:hypothetical protein